jgi:hypothetical protein
MVVVIIIVLLVGVIGYFKLSADPEVFKIRAKGRTEDQKKALRYFLVKDGCLKKTVEDEEYDALVATHVAKLNIKEKAMKKIGLDEDQLKEIEPVHFQQYLFENKGKNYAKKGKDGIYRSSAYQITWLFFSSSEVYLYQYTFNLDEDGKKERTEEYFYKDITTFSTTDDTIEVRVGDVLVNIDTTRFRLVVPGESFFCAMDPNDYTERAIQGMKAKLREKKG